MLANIAAVAFGALVGVLLFLWLDGVERWPPGLAAGLAGSLLALAIGADNVDLAWRWLADRARQFLVALTEFVAEVIDALRRNR